jgi:uncharacterized iron-regulated membrane protein
VPYGEASRNTINHAEEIMVKKVLQFLFVVLFGLASASCHGTASRSDPTPTQAASTTTASGSESQTATVPTAEASPTIGQVPSALPSAAPSEGIEEAGQSTIRCPNDSPIEYVITPAAGASCNGSAAVFDLGNQTVTFELAIQGDQMSYKVPKEWTCVSTFQSGYLPVKGTYSLSVGFPDGTIPAEEGFACSGQLYKAWVFFKEAVTWK